MQFVTGTKASVACVILALLITESGALVILPRPPPPPSPADGPVATCSNTDSSTPLIQKSDCAASALYLDEIGQEGTGCGTSEANHDENGCTWMNTRRTCNTNICNFKWGSGANCSTVAKYIRRAYDGCANDDGTLPAASFPIPSGGFVSVTYNGQYEQEPHP